MKNSRIAYGVCVALSIGLVAVGWIFTVGKTLGVNISQVKNQVNESARTVRSEIGDTHIIKDQSLVKRIKSNGNIKEMIDFTNKERLISGQLIQSLKARIEDDSYDSKKEETTVQTE